MQHVTTSILGTWYAQFHIMNSKYLYLVICYISTIRFDKFNFRYGANKWRTMIFKSIKSFIILKMQQKANITMNFSKMY